MWPTLDGETQEVLQYGTLLPLLSPGTAFQSTTH